MNKFLNHRVRAEKQDVCEKKSTVYKQETDFLNMCASCWDALDEARRKMRRFFL